MRCLCHKRTEWPALPQATCLDERCRWAFLAPVQACRAALPLPQLVQRCESLKYILTHCTC